MALSTSQLGKLVNRGAGLASRLYRAITGRSERQTDAQRIAELEKSAGSGRKAAAALGVPETTWRGWRKRGQIPPTQAQKVEGAVRRARLAPGREANMRQSLAGGRLLVSGWLSVSDEPPSERRFLTKDYFTESDNRDIVNAYLSGDDARLEAAFENAVDSSYYGGDWSDITVEWKAQ